MLHNIDNKIGQSNLMDLQKLCSQWRLLLTIGVLFLISGMVATAFSVFTTYVSVFFIGSMLALSAIFHLVYSFVIHQWKGFFVNIALAILHGITGALLLYNPTVGAMAITLILAILFLSTGLIRLVAGLTMQLEHKGWIILNAVAAILLGILILAQWPSSALWVLGLFVGIEMLLAGWLMIFMALKMKNSPCGQ